MFPTVGALPSTGLKCFPTAACESSHSHESLARKLERRLRLAVPALLLGCALIALISFPHGQPADPLLMPTLVHNSHHEPLLRIRRA